MIFSVIVPTYNRLASLRRTLESLFSQDFDDYEIIVVNDGSNDGTSQYLSALASEGRIRHIEQENRGPSAARNAGLRAAAGVYIAYTDDDCRVPADWLAGLLDHFEKEGVDFLGGVVRNCVPDDLCAGISQEITNHFVNTLGVGGGSTPFLTSNNIAYRAETLRRAGGFDERFRVAGGEERALNHRILSDGGSSVLAMDIVVDHFHELRFKGFFRQQFNYGRGAYILYRVVGRETPAPPGVMPKLAYASVVKSFFGNGIRGGLAKTAMFGLAQCSVALGFVYQAFVPVRPVRVIG
jgi:glycosyltransferase involved in cell wall biosynthesis